MFAEMIDAFVNWETTSQVVVGGGFAAGLAGLYRYHADRTRYRAEAAKEAAEVARSFMVTAEDGRDYRVEPDPPVIWHWCQQCDRNHRLMDMRWCDYGARWLCRTCAADWPSGLAAAVVDKARADATTRLQDLLTETAEAASAEPESMAAVIPIFATAPTKVGVTKDGHRVEVFENLSVARARAQAWGGVVTGTPGHYVVTDKPRRCDCDRQVDAAGRVLFIDHQCGAL